MESKRDLDSLSVSKKLAFILLLCERMMPAFQKFSADTGFYISRYQGYLERGWAYLNGKSNLGGYEDASRDCYDNAPDTEAFDHVLTSAALNATLSIGALMSFLSDHNVDHIIEVTDLARDTVALYVQITEAVPPLSLGFDEVMNHPLVQQELLRQEEDLRFLSSLPDNVEREEVQQIKKRLERMSELIPFDMEPGQSKKNKMYL